MSFFNGKQIPADSIFLLTLACHILNTQTVVAFWASPQLG